MHFALLLKQSKKKLKNILRIRKKKKCSYRSVTYAFFLLFGEYPIFESLIFPIDASLKSFVVFALLQNFVDDVVRLGVLRPCSKLLSIEI